MSIAIAVPSLNQKRFLGDALDSLGRTDVTVLRAVLDGGSNDGSKELIESRESELAFWRSEPDDGQAAAINEGIRRLCIEHPDIEAVGWLNADDFFLEHGIDRLCQALRDHPDWLAVSGRAALASENGALVDEIPTEPFSSIRFARACTICQPASLIRRSAWERIGGLDGSLEMCFDFDLWWRIGRIGAIGHVEAVVAASRDHGETKTRRRRIQYFREATAIVKRETGAIPWHWYVSEAIERQVQYEVGRRPPVAARLRARLQAASAYLRDTRPRFPI